MTDEWSGAPGCGPGSGTLIDLKAYQATLWPHRSPARSVSVQVHPGVGWWPDALPIYEVGSPVVIAPSGTEELVEYNVPLNFVGTGMYIGGDAAAAAWDDLGFITRRNGTPMITFPTGIGQQFGLLPYEHFRTYLSLDQGDSWTLNCTNNSTATATVTGVLKGMRWIATDVEKGG